MSTMIDRPPESVAEIGELVAMLAERALAVTAGARRAPSAVRVAAGAIEVEVTWPAEHRPAPSVARTAGPEPVARDAVTDDGAPNDPDTFALCASVVGVFYRAPEPGAAPFVTEGDVVRAGQQVGIVEAMKLMIPVEADRPGELVEVLVADGMPVEHGQPLMLLRGVGQ